MKKKTLYAVVLGYATASLLNNLNVSVESWKFYVLAVTIILIGLIAYELCKNDNPVKR